jgi:hypothetical protein
MTLAYLTQPLLETSKPNRRDSSFVEKPPSAPRRSSDCHSASSSRQGANTSSTSESSRAVADARHCPHHNTVAATKFDRLAVDVELDAPGHNVHKLFMRTNCDLYPTLPSHNVSALTSSSRRGPIAGAASPGSGDDTVVPFVRRVAEAIFFHTPPQRCPDTRESRFRTHLCCCIVQGPGIELSWPWSPEANSFRS